jgi:tetratricopeptide (TPR) repeat protein
MQAPVTRQATRRPTGARDAPIAPKTVRRAGPVFLGLVLLALTLGSTARAEKIDALYQSALQQYYAGEYAEAAERFERLVAIPIHHEELFYNLGNAYYRSGKLGPAIYNYERALALAPDFDDARYNLELARKAAHKRIKVVIEGSLEQPWWVRAARTVSLRGWWAIVIVLWWLVLALLVAVRRTEHGAGRAAMVAVNGLLAVGLLGAALMLVGRIQLDEGRREAIILPAEIAAHEGPSASARESFKLHAGLRVRVQEQSDGWARVRLANGLEAWVSRRAIGVL